ncbi:MAG: AAA family ATPase, partial [Candidatus Magasanikbacteria bacterium]|nr:AAA family ATPase [Candidatus Magasanikbacteria bacterium]
MKQNETIFMCANCDAQYTKWIGRCLECGKWGTLTQETVIKKKSGATTQSTAKKPTAVGDVSLEKQGRIETPLAEWNRVLGGGMVPGSFILLGGEPGIGKSTLSLQIAVSVNKTLYISGEESIGQIKM